MIEGTNAYFFPTAVQLLFQRHIFQCLGHAFSEQVIAALGFATIVSPKLLNPIPKNCWWEISHFFEADKRFEIKVGDHDINDIHDAMMHVYIRLLRCIRP